MVQDGSVVISCASLTLLFDGGIAFHWAGLQGRAGLGSSLAVSGHQRPILPG